MSKPWGSIGDWAADVEREEQEAAAASAAAPPHTYPSLRESVSTKPKKKKMTLTEFYTSSTAGSGGVGAFSGSGGLTTEEMLRLPTGPKERSAEEMQFGNRLGGGFTSYGRTSQGGIDRNNNNNNNNNNFNSNRRQFGGFDEGRRSNLPSRVSDYDQQQMSRADEVDNWTRGKNLLADNKSRYPLGGGGSGGPSGSRADEVDDWTRGKKQPSFGSNNTASVSRSSTFGSGFRGDYYSGGGGGRAESERWGHSGGGGGEFRGVERDQERPRLVLDPPKGDLGGGGERGGSVVKSNKPNPFGAARPREEVLAEKGLDWKKIDMEIEAKKVPSAHSSRPTSAHSSRPSSAQSGRSEGLGLQQGLENLGVKSRPKVNPFGDAKPREVLLQERGQDWRKIDLELEHRRVERPDTEEERLLKEEIEHLKKEAEKRGSLQGPGGDEPSLQAIVSQKENELEQLARDLDDRVRFGPKAVERPGSGASSRAGSFSERPSSRSGSFDDSRSMGYMDRPRSRGTPDVWTRPGEDRRAFQGGRERGFLGNRDFDRSMSRERW